MIGTTTELRGLLSAFAEGTLPYRTLDEEMARLGEVIADLRDPTLELLYGRVELLLAEYSSGHLDADELWAETRELAPVALIMEPRPALVVRTFAAASRSSFTNPRPLLVPGPSLDGDTARAVVPA